MNFFLQINLNYFLAIDLFFYMGEGCSGLQFALSWMCVDLNFLHAFVTK